MEGAWEQGYIASVSRKVRNNVANYYHYVYVVRIEFQNGCFGAKKLPSETLVAVLPNNTHVSTQECMMTSSLFRRNNDDVVMCSWSILKYLHVTAVERKSAKFYIIELMYHPNYTYTIHMPDVIDIVNDQLSGSDYKKEEDPGNYISQRTGRGPLADDWIFNPPDGVIMCSYKLIKVID